MRWWRHNVDVVDVVGGGAGVVVTFVVDAVGVCAAVLVCRVALVAVVCRVVLAAVVVVTRR